MSSDFSGSGPENGVRVGNSHAGILGIEQRPVVSGQLLEKA
jgi:hypothetical protein